MNKEMKGMLLVGILFLSVIFITPVLAGYNNRNGSNGYKGTNKYSNQLPEQSKVPRPAGIVEDILASPGTPHVVEGCRARGPTIMISVPGLGLAPGGPCCKGPQIDAISYAPNQCCNPPDTLYTQNEFTPGNHCLCFVMRMFAE